MSTTSALQSLVALLRNTNAATLRSVLLQWSLHDVADALVQLPVADFVPIDDVLDAAQDMATRDLQRFGGSAALGEPHMTVSAARMIKKRAGWLVVLCLGEVLTTTAMGSSSRRLRVPWCWHCLSR
jgi:magnesium transporter